MLHEYGCVWTTVSQDFCMPSKVYALNTRKAHIGSSDRVTISTMCVYHCCQRLTQYFSSLNFSSLVAVARICVLVYAHVRMCMCFFLLHLIVYDLRVNLCFKDVYSEQMCVYVRRLLPHSVKSVAFKDSFTWIPCMFHTSIETLKEGKLSLPRNITDTLTYIQRVRRIVIHSMHIHTHKHIRFLSFFAPSYLLFSTTQSFQ